MYSFWVWGDLKEGLFQEETNLSQDLKDKNGADFPKPGVGVFSYRGHSKYKGLELEKCLAVWSNNRD